MRIGLSYTLKSDSPAPADRPDDWQEEFDPPATVAALAAALRTLGHEVAELGDGREFVQRLLADPPDLVFNIAEGHGTSRGREARVPAVCEMLGVPCTGSDPLTLAASLDKDVARRLVESPEVPVPRGIVLRPDREVYDGHGAEFYPVLVESGLELPVIVKPLFEGSSKGIRRTSLVRRPDELGPAITGLWRDYRQPVLVEEFIAGDEVTVGVIGNAPPRVLGVMRVVPRQPAEHFVYSLEVKRDWQNQVTYECPAKLPHAVLDAIEVAALAAYEALGCRDLARIDFRVRGGVPYFLEANPLPGLSPETGDVVLIARAAGMRYEDLVGAVVGEALARTARGG